MERTTPVIPAEDIQRQKEYCAEIRALNEPYHMVSVLYFLEENSIDEIARRLERPPKTVHTQLYRAKQLLKNALERGKG